MIIKSKIFNLRVYGAWTGTSVCDWKYADLIVNLVVTGEHCLPSELECSFSAAPFSGSTMDSMDSTVVFRPVPFRLSLASSPSPTGLSVDSLSSLLQFESSRFFRLCYSWCQLREIKKNKKILWKSLLIKASVSNMDLLGFLITTYLVSRIRILPFLTKN